MTLDLAAILATAPNILEPEFAYSRSRVDRLDQRRKDAGWLGEMLASDQARFLVLSGDRAYTRPHASGNGISPAASDDCALPRPDAERLSADFSQPILLGQQDQTVYFALAAPAHEDDALAELGFRSHALRSLALYDVVERPVLNLLAQARSLLHWHESHRFCAKCGERSLMREAGYRRDCPACESLHFPRTDPAVIMLATHGDMCILGRPPHLQEGVYTTLAGFMEPGETIEDAVRRELHEEVGAETGAVHYFASQPWPFPGQLMIGCFAEVAERPLVIDYTEMEDARWFHRDDVRAMLSAGPDDPMRLPPRISIACHLIQHWVDL